MGRTDRVVSALHAATNLGNYPVVTAMLRIFATIPVTTVSDERSFSALKHIKNYLRSTMNEVRLDGLAQMYIDRYISFDYNRVVEEFAKGNHRLNFN